MSPAYLFRKVAIEHVAIETDGGSVTMTRWEALMRQIHTCERCTIARSDTTAVSGKASAR
jgi:hypothetical protein